MIKATTIFISIVTFSFEADRTSLVRIHCPFCVISRVAFSVRSPADPIMSSDLLQVAIEKDVCTLGLIS